MVTVGRRAVGRQAGQAGTDFPLGSGQWWWKAVVVMVMVGVS